MKKYLVMLWLIPAAMGVTLLVAAFSYVWLNQQLLDAGRASVAGFVMFISLITLMMVEDAP